MLRTSSRFTSSGLPLTVSDSVVSETPVSFPSIFFPFFSFVTSLLPDVTVLSADQSCFGTVVPCANVTDGSNREANSTRLIVNLFLSMPMKSSFEVGLVRLFGPRARPDRLIDSETSGATGSTFRRVSFINATFPECSYHREGMNERLFELHSTRCRL